MMCPYGVSGSSALHLGGLKHPFEPGAPRNKSKPLSLGLLCCSAQAVGDIPTESGKPVCHLGCQGRSAFKAEK